MDLPIRIFNPDGTPNTTLVKANVKLKEWTDAGAWGDEISYYDLWKINAFGYYVIQGITAFKRVGLFIDDVEQYWWGKQWVGEPSAGFLKLAGGTMTGMIVLSGDPTAALHPVTKQYVEANFVPLSGGAEVSGLIEFDTIPQLVNEEGDPLTPSNPGDAVNLNYLQGYYPLKTNILSLPSNVIILDASIAATSGRICKTFADVQAYIGALGTPPAVGNEYQVWILPHKNRTAGYNESFTAQNYVHYVGVGGRVLINGTLSGAGSTNSFENIYLIAPGNFTLQNTKARNSIFACVSAASPVLTIQNNKFENVGLYPYSSEGGTSSIVSSGGNEFHGNCHSNVDFEKNSTDIGKVSSLGNKNILAIY